MEQRLRLEDGVAKDLSKLGFIRKCKVIAGGRTLIRQGSACRGMRRRGSEQRRKRRIIIRRRWSLKMAKRRRRKRCSGKRTKRKTRKM